MQARLCAGATVVAILVLAACKPAVVPTAEQTVAVAPVPAFNAADEASIKGDAVARLQKRTFGMASLGTKHSCSEYFSLGSPQIIDSTLGEQAGKVRLLVPISLFNTDADGRAPDIACYGFAHPGWLLNQPNNVAFEFQVERWQTGWHVSEMQANGF